MNRAIPVQFRSRRDERFNSEGFESGGGFGRQNRGTFHASLEGGMGGRNVGGEWQVELPDAARDPREVIREQRRQNAESDEESFGKTSGLEYRPEDYPALISESESSQPLWVGRKSGQKSSNEDFPSLSSGGRGVVTTGWGGTVKVNNKLTVVKPRGPPQPSPQSIPRPAAGGIKGAAVVGFHPPAPPPKHIPAQQKDKKPSGISVHPTTRAPITSDSPKLQAAVEELTLAEKIKSMSSKGTTTVASANSQVRVPSPAVHDYPPIAASPSPNTLVRDSPDDYPALPSSKKEKKSGKASSVSNSGASWNSALSSYGFEGSKSGKTGSGIYLAKPKSIPSTASASSPLANDPPPGFVLLDNEPPPGFFSPATNLDNNADGQKKSKSNSANPTNQSRESSRTDFPGNWAPIGGSRGVHSPNESPANVSEALVSESDFPALSGKNNTQGGATVAAGQKKSKSKKQQKQNELQSLAFKVKR
jgi:hypothetical protein